MKGTIKHSLMPVLAILLVAVMFTSVAYAATSVVNDATGDVGPAAPP